ncbi:MAG: DUF4373 domain-containing protein, partial [Clostridia bacterium]|nr:DUF4373 domain-containing protein [Clostridia bacterium]
MSKDVYYFSHDCNARYDPKILALRSVYGVKGYGLFFILLEIMRGEEGYKIRCDDLFYTSLSMQTCEDAATLKAITEDCVNKFGLFKTDGEYIWSESFLRRMEKMEEFRDRMSEAGKRSAEKRRLK